VKNYHLLLLNQVIEELYFATLVLNVITNIAAVATGDLAPAQTTNLIVSTDAKTALLPL